MSVLDGGSTSFRDPSEEPIELSRHDSDTAGYNPKNVSTSSLMSESLPRWPLPIADKGRIRSTKLSLLSGPGPQINSD
jgi:hypothetical protein